MLSAAILVVSSKIVSGQEQDKGRGDLERILSEHSIQIKAYEVLPDERDAIRARLVRCCDETEANIVLTIGGTGVRPTDCTPEATRDVIEKEIPGIGEGMRLESLKKMRTAMLSRGTAGIRGRTLIVNLPGSVKGVRDNLMVILPILQHTVEKIAGTAHEVGQQNVGVA